MDRRKISIIIPAYRIEPIIEVVEKALNGFNYEIIVQPDNLGEGKGITLQRGFKRSTGNLIVWLDADMQLHPSYIPKMIQILDDNNADIVIASKWHKDSIVNIPTVRRVLSFFSSLIIRFLFRMPIKDTQTGLKLFKRGILDNQWHIRGFGHDVEVLYTAYKKGHKIVEFPVQIIDSSVNFNSFIKTLQEILWLKFH